LLEVRIKSVRIRSYKSFEDTGTVKLGEHFTVLVGQNSAGKSAFLEAFATDRLPHNPHRGPKRHAAAPLPPSTLTFDLEVPGPEHKRAALARGSAHFASTEGIGIGILDVHFAQTNRYVLSYSPSSYTLDSRLFDRQGSGRQDVQVSANADLFTGEFADPRISYRSPPIDHTTEYVSSIFRQTTFVFRAERYNVGRSGMSGYETLLPDASNLPYMLLRLNRDYKAMERFQELVAEVLPFIRRVVVSAFGQEVEISIQSNPELRADLATPLNECGTGVAQVLAIIYVLVAYDAAQIVIDEPNSFLHPGATRRLLQILKRFANHQFILSTHAAEVISVLRPEVLLLLKWEPASGETVVTADSGANVAHLRESLGELGASLTDVFGYDVVVFVEGPTEHRCFPLLTPAAESRTINYVAMREASRLTSKSPEAVFDIYRKGVEGSALEPPTTRFSFDREGRSEQQMADVLRSSRGQARFIEAPMYESYLLHPGAIAALLGALEGETINAEAVQAWIMENWTRFPVKGLPLSSVEMCHAGDLLEDMFSTLTDGRHSYLKLTHGEQLTRWLLESDPGHLERIASYVEGLLEGS